MTNVMLSAGGVLLLAGVAVFWFLVFRALWRVGSRR